MKLIPLVTFVVVASAVLLEMCLRIFTMSGTFAGFPLAPFDRSAPVRVLNGVDMSKAYLVFDHDTGWTVGPTRTSLNGLYRSSGAGLRITPASPEPAPGAKVFAIAYGDSFTHCDDVPEDATFENALAKLVNAPVLNGGVPGFGVDQAWLRYRAQKELFKSEHVIIGFMPDNIGRHVNRFRPHISPVEGICFAKPRFLSKNGALELLPQPFATAEEYKAPDLTPKLTELSRNDDWYRPEAYEARPEDYWRSARVVRTLKARRATGPEAWRALYERADAVELTARILRDFASEVATDGRKPLVLVLPDRTVTRDAVAGRPRLHDPVITPLKRAGVRVLDMTDAVSAYVKAQPTDDKLFLPHYSRELNDVVATELAKALR